MSLVKSMHNVGIIELESIGMYPTLLLTSDPYALDGYSVSWMKV